jgi:hypothetical protein
MKENKINGRHRTHGGDEKCINDFSGNIFFFFLFIPYAFFRRRNFVLLMDP